MTPVLYVGNRNYSSWSLRPWLVLRWAEIDFETKAIALGGDGYGSRRMPGVLAVSPSGTVPVLSWNGEIIGDSLAICEWAAEQVPSLWPDDPVARAHARSVTCEMHSGFSALRSTLSCNIRRRAEPRALSDDVRADVRRIEAIWTTLRARFGEGGPYLFGAAPTVADAFFTPVATRFRTYAVPLTPVAQSYAQALLGNARFREWETEAQGEAWTMPQTDAI